MHPCTHDKPYASALVRLTLLFVQSTTIFLATLLVISSILKLIQPQDTIDTIVALFGILNISTNNTPEFFFSTLIFFEFLLGGFTFLFCKSIYTTSMLAGLYAFFFFSIALLYIFSPETNCGCGISEEDGTTLATIAKSGIFFLLAIVQIRKENLSILMLPFTGVSDQSKGLA